MNKEKKIKNENKNKNKIKIEDSFVNEDDIKINKKDDINDDDIKIKKDDSNKCINFDHKYSFNFNMNIQDILLKENEDKKFTLKKSFSTYYLNNNVNNNDYIFVKKMI